MDVSIRDRMNAGWLWLACLLVLGGALLRAGYYRGNYQHPDEIITVGVVAHLRESGTWDTNWENAEFPGAKHNFRYGQFNFSSHHLATYGYEALVRRLPGTAAWLDAGNGLWAFRFFAAMLSTVAIWQVMRLGKRVGGWHVALTGGVLVAVAPQLVEDAHYARPDAFVTVLTLGVVMLSWPQLPLSRWRVAGAAFLAGLLVACKVSMLALVWLPLVPLVATRHWRSLWIVPAAGVAGFVAGVPGVLSYPRAFSQGIRVLARQYAGIQLPHSHLGGGPVAELMGRFFVATLGWPVLIAGLVGAFVLLRRRRWAEILLLAGPVALFAGYFSTRSVFFERNLSHVVPLFLILAAVGVSACAEQIAAVGKVPATVGVVALAAALAWPAVRITAPLVATEFSGGGVAQRAAFVERLRLRFAAMPWREAAVYDDRPLDDLAHHFEAGGGASLVHLEDYSDEAAQRYATELFGRFEARQVADYPGTFPDLPVSTLRTYHSAHDRWFLVTGRPGG